VVAQCSKQTYFLSSFQGEKLKGKGLDFEEVRQVKGVADAKFENC
jgi:hypothetical protein